MLDTVDFQNRLSKLARPTFQWRQYSSDKSSTLPVQVVGHGLLVAMDLDSWAVAWTQTHATEAATAAT